MSISSYARKYADALDALERARSWIKTMSAEKITATVTTNSGSAVDGYRDVFAVISEIVSKEIDSYVGRVEAELDYRVKRAHGALEDAALLGSKGRMRAGDVSSVEKKVDVLPGTWLQIGGEQGGNLLGAGTVMIRVSDGGAAWHWHALSPRELDVLTALANAAPRNEKGELL